MLYGSLSAGKLFQGALFKGSLFGAGGDPLAALITALFGASEQGGLWLPGPTTCFTDTAGTTAAGVGDTVARINDSSGNGNNVTQATAGARPALGRTVEGGRRNLLQRTGLLNLNGVNDWARSYVTLIVEEAEVPPVSGAQVVRLTETTATSAHQFFNNDGMGVVTITGQFHTLTFYVKKGTGTSAPDWIQIGVIAAVASWQNFNLTTLAVGNSGIVDSASITDVGNGWRRVRVTYNQSATGSQFSQRVRILFTNNQDTADASPSYAGSTDADIYISAPQYEMSNTATPYQRVGTTALDVTEAGKAELWYLAFDGIDDFMDAGAFNMGSDVYTCVAAQIKNYSAHGYLMGQGNGVLNTHLIKTLSSDRIQARHCADGTVQTPTITLSNPLDPKVITFEAYNTSPLTTLQINGETTVQTAISVGTGTYSDNLRIGYFDANYVFMDMNFFGAVSRAGITAADQNTAARTFLAARSGVTLP